LARDRLNRHLLVDPDLGVFPGDAVHLDRPFAAIVRVTRHHLGDGPALAFDPDDLAHFQSQGLHVVGVDARDRPAHVLGQGLLDLEISHAIC
jgi:hypothetical protein